MKKTTAESIMEKIIGFDSWVKFWRDEGAKNRKLEREYEQRLDSIINSKSFHEQADEYYNEPANFPN